MVKEKTRALSEIEDDLAAAAEALEESKQATSRARSVETSNLNDYNRLCKEFDSAVEALRKSAPTETDWSRSVTPKKYYAAE